MPQVSLPVGMFLAPFMEKISQGMFLDTLRTSNNHYIEWQQIYKYWDNVSETVEVSVYSPNILDNDKTSLPQIAVRTNNDTEIDCIELLVEGKSGHVKYQDVLKIYNVGPLPTIICAPSIPLRSFHISEDGGYFSTLDSISIQRKGMGPNEPKLKPEIIYSDTELLNDRFIKKWDYYWNMRAIDSACGNIKSKLSYYLIQPKILYARRENIPKKEMLKGLARLFIGKPVYFILSREFMLKTYFWLPIILRLRKFEIKDC